MKWRVLIFILIVLPIISVIASNVKAVTLTNLTPIDDTFFDTSNPDSNNGNYDPAEQLPSLLIGGANNFTARFIFNIPSIPTTDRITDCKLDLSLVTNSGLSNSIFLGNFSTNNSLNNGTGNETEASWNWYNQSYQGSPAAGSTGVYTNVTNFTNMTTSFTVSGQTNRTLSINCTNFANTKVQQGNATPNITFILWSNNSAAYQFVSRGILGTGDQPNHHLAPRLNITSSAAISLASASLNVTNTTLTTTGDFINASVTVEDLGSNKANLTLVFYVNNVANQTVQITNNLGAGSFSYIFNNTNVSRTQTIVVQFNGTNGAGASNYINTSIVTVNNSVPSRPTIIVPSNDTLVTTRNLTISWNNATDSDGQALTCNLDISTNSGFTGIVHSASALSQGVQPTRYNITELNRTSYWLRNRCSDTLDNGTYDYSNFTIDGVVPNLTIGSPNATFTSQSNIPLNWTYRDNSGSSGSCFYNITRTNGVIEVADTAINCTGATNLTFSVALNAVFIANVRGNDSAGNLNLTNTTFTINEVAVDVGGGGGGGGSPAENIGSELNATCSQDKDCKSGLCDLLGRKVCILQTELCGNNVCDRERKEIFDQCPADCGFANNLAAITRNIGAEKEILIIIGVLFAGVIFIYNREYINRYIKAKFGKKKEQKIGT